MTPMEIVLAILLAAFGSGGLVSWLHIRTTRDKDISVTDKNRAEAQAVIIESLQQENARLAEDINNLRGEVAELRGHLEAMERLKVQQIAHQTAKQVVAELIGDPAVNLDYDQA